MQFGLFGSAAARRPNSSEAAEFDSSEGFRDFIDYNVEAEALAFTAPLSSSIISPAMGKCRRRSIC